MAKIAIITGASQGIGRGIFRQPRITRCRPISASLRWTLPPLRIRKGCKSFHRFQTELLMQLKLLFLRCRYCVSIRFCRNISSQA